MQVRNLLPAVAGGLPPGWAPADGNEEAGAFSAELLRASLPQEGELAPVLPAAQVQSADIGDPSASQTDAAAWDLQAIMAGAQPPGIARLLSQADIPADAALPAAVAGSDQLLAGSPALTWSAELTGAASSPTVLPTAASALAGREQASAAWWAAPSTASGAAPATATATGMQALAESDAGETALATPSLDKAQADAAGGLVPSAAAAVLPTATGSGRLDRSAATNAAQPEAPIRATGLARAFDRAAEPATDRPDVGLSRAVSRAAAQAGEATRTARERTVRERAQREQTVRDGEATRVGREGPAGRARAGSSDLNPAASSALTSADSGTLDAGAVAAQPDAANAQATALASAATPSALERPAGEAAVHSEPPLAAGPSAASAASAAFATTGDGGRVRDAATRTALANAGDATRTTASAGSNRPAWAQAAAAAEAAQRGREPGPDTVTAPSASTSAQTSASSASASAAGVAAPAPERPAPNPVDTAARAAVMQAAAGRSAALAASVTERTADSSAQVAAAAAESAAAKLSEPATAGTRPAAEPAFVMPAAPAAAATGPSGPAPAEPARAPVAEVMLAARWESPEALPALGRQIAFFAREGIEHARVQLNPVDLGPIQVQLALDGSQVRLELAAEVASTRALLEQSLPSLASSLREGGFTLSGGGVFQEPRRGDGSGEPSRGSAGRAQGADEAGDAGARAAPVAVRRSAGLVDVFA